MKKTLLLILLAGTMNSIAQSNFKAVDGVKGGKNGVAINSFVLNGKYLYVGSNFSRTYLKTYNIPVQPDM